MRLITGISEDSNSPNYKYERLSNGEIVWNDTVSWEELRKHNTVEALKAKPINIELDPLKQV